MLNAIDLAGHFSEQYSESEKNQSHLLDRHITVGQFLTLRNIQVRKLLPHLFPL